LPRSQKEETRKEGITRGECSADLISLRSRKAEDKKRKKEMHTRREKRAAVMPERVSSIYGPCRRGVKERPNGSDANSGIYERQEKRKGPPKR